MEKKEAIKILKDFHDKSALFSVRTALETLCPELKEPDDREIRKALLNYMTKMWENSLDDVCGVHVGDVIVWLEKQGESYTKRDVDDAWLKGMCDAKDELEKQGEQKPTWSEEDEERLSDAIFFVREYQIPTRDKKLLEAAKETEDWLKSLKKRIGG